MSSCLSCRTPPAFASSDFSTHAFTHSGLYYSNRLEDGWKLCVSHYSEVGQAENPAFTSVSNVRAAGDKHNQTQEPQLSAERVGRLGPKHFHQHLVLVRQRLGANVSSEWLRISRCLRRLPVPPIRPRFGRLGALGGWISTILPRVFVAEKRSPTPWRHR